MDRQTMRHLAADARVGRLATVDAAGNPHAVPACFALIGEVAYSAVDRKPKRGTPLRRFANVAATGRACLLVDAYDEDWSRLWWVRLDGPARVVDEPAESGRALAALVQKYRQYAAASPPGPVMAIDVERWTGWAAAPGDR
ncbi:MAG TPA: TIGR03668 family PPOX class F420-dependent oxidoreductase [Micromonosporaceae bacterium]|jgi:PPOX class probable F420-dependent enzyme|nr:TIGR03668 family PPOX class F420-dependent oxidoreductase [Micromonosporaceae bacterium]